MKINFHDGWEKKIPHNIYELLCPVALAHMIMGDGASRDYGLTLISYILLKLF